MQTDLEIAQACRLKPISEIAAAAGALNVAAFGPMEGKISPENVQAMRDGTFQF